nr:MYB transcription factor protein [Rosa persica]
MGGSCVVCNWAFLNDASPTRAPEGKKSFASLLTSLTIPISDVPQPVIRDGITAVKISEDGYQLGLENCKYASQVPETQLSPMVVASPRVFSPALSAGGLACIATVPIVNAFHALVDESDSEGENTHSSDNDTISKTHSHQEIPKDKAQSSKGMVSNVGASINWYDELEKAAEEEFTTVVSRSQQKKTAILASANGDPKNLSNLSHIAQWESARLQAEARFVRQSKLLKPAPPAPQCLDFNLRTWETLMMSKSLAGGGGGGDEAGVVGRATNVVQEFEVPKLTIPAALDFNEVSEESGTDEYGDLFEALLLQQSYNNTGFDVVDAWTLEQCNDISADYQNVIMSGGLKNLFMFR